MDRAEVTRTFTMPVDLAIEDARGIRPDPSGANWLTGDTNIIQLRAKVNYRIADPAKYLFGSEQPAEILRYVAGSAFTETPSALPVDDLLTSGRHRARPGAHGRRSAHLVLARGTLRHGQRLIDGGGDVFVVGVGEVREDLCGFLRTDSGDGFDRCQEQRLVGLL